MSQIQHFGLGGMPPAGPIATLTGDDGLPVSPTANNIFILGEDPLSSYGFARVEKSLGVSTLDIAPLFTIVTSLDNTYTTLYTLTFLPNTAAFLAARVVGFKDDLSVVTGGAFIGVARKVGAAAVTVPKVSGSLITDKAAGPFPLARIINVGDTLELQVSGAVLGDVYNWTAHITYQFEL